MYGTTFRNVLQIIDLRPLHFLECSESAGRSKPLPVLAGSGKLALFGRMGTIAELQRAKNYRRSLRGLVVRMYAAMKSRVSIPRSHSKCFGLPIMPRSEFMVLADASPALRSLYEAWTASGYDRRLTPSVDRLDRRKGYTPDNIDFCTTTENARRFILKDFRGKPKHSKYRGVRPSRGKWSAIIKTGGKVFWLGTFDREEDAAIVYNVAAQLFFGPDAQLNPV